MLSSVRSQPVSGVFSLACFHKLLRRGVYHNISILKPVGSQRAKQYKLPLSDNQLGTATWDVIVILSASKLRGSAVLLHFTARESPHWLVQMCRSQVQFLNA